MERDTFQSTDFCLEQQCKHFEHTLFCMMQLLEEPGVYQVIPFMTHLELNHIKDDKTDMEKAHKGQEAVKLIHAGLQSEYKHRFKLQVAFQQQTMNHSCLAIGMQQQLQNAAGSQINTCWAANSIQALRQAAGQYGTAPVAFLTDSCAACQELGAIGLTKETCQNSGLQVELADNACSILLEHIVQHLPVGVGLCTAQMCSKHPLTTWNIQAIYSLLTAANLGHRSYLC